MGASGLLYGYAQFAQIHQGMYLWSCVLFLYQFNNVFKNPFVFEVIILNLVSMPNVITPISSNKPKKMLMNENL